jgi:hypothetical protein
MEGGDRNAVRKVRVKQAGASTFWMPASKGLKSKKKGEMKMQISKNKGRTILIAGIVLVALALTASTGAAYGGEALEEHVAHIAEDLCEMGSTVKLLTYAVIGLFVVSAISLIVSLVKKQNDC